MNTEIKRKLGICSSKEHKETIISRRIMSAINSAKEIKEDKECKVSTEFDHESLSRIFQRYTGTKKQISVD